MTAPTIWSFVDEFLVVCPCCGGKAVVKASTDEIPPRLTCLPCGLARDWESASPGVLTSHSSGTWPAGQYALGDAADAYFHLPLWLQVPCGGNTLWAYNARHVAFLREYVASTQRRRSPRADSGPLNTRLASRLPRGIKLAKNRDTVLRAISKLEEKL